MFIKELKDIDFQSVEYFCKEFKEGIRVEYKSEIPKNLPKTISAFANMLGGILIVGVKTDKTTNKVIFPIEGMNEEEGIEEKIIASSLMGIYPPIIPEVRIIEVPQIKDKIVVIVRVNESRDAPHAIQNSTIVYIRTESISQPYELAQIDRIEYMLKRREGAVEKRNELIIRSKERFTDCLTPSMSYMNITICPLYTHRPLLDVGSIYKFANGIFTDEALRGTDSRTRRIDQGILNYIFCPEYFRYYEFNQYGLIFFCKSLLKKKPSRGVSDPEISSIEYISFAALVIDICKFLKLSDSYLKESKYFGNLDIRLILHNVKKERLFYFDDTHSNLNFSSIESEIITRIIEESVSLSNNLLQIIIDLMKQVSWCFNCDQLDLEKKVTAILETNRLVI